jgi:low affinity Fe/Cu permease
MSKKFFNITHIQTWSSKKAGSPLAFVTALIVLALWILGGLVWGFSDTWLLVINTVATINASLMVFIIQSTQNRESKALHAKIDGLIHASKEAENQLIAIEELEEEEIEKIRQYFKEKKNQ